MPPQHRETAKHHQAFEQFYAADRDYRKTSENLGVPEGTLRTWGDWFSWRARADKRDAEIARRADADSIKRRAAMLVRHRQAAELMQRRGIEHFSKTAIDTARDAITAITKGVELERQVEGLPQWVGEILNADADRLRSILAEVESGLAACESDSDTAPLGVGAGAEDGGERF